MKTYEVIKTYEYVTYANEKDIINYFINNFDMTEKEAKKHFESLSVSDIEEIINCSGDWEPLENDELTFVDSIMFINED